MRKYLGKEIYPVQYGDKARAGFRWYVQTYHSPTGIPLDSQHCPHYFTLAQAKSEIRRNREETTETA